MEMIMLKFGLVLIGCVATVLAVLGVLLPGLPATPFLLVALWAFARSSERLYRGVQAIPILQLALREAERFEQKRAMRLSVKLTAVTMAWASVIFTYVLSRGTVNVVLLCVAAAAMAGTVFVALIPTDSE